MTFLGLLMVAVLHPVHETVAEVQWNPETSRTEVAVRLDALDEQWLHQRSSPKADKSKWAVNYLRRNFRFSGDLASIESDAKKPLSDPSNYRWIGSKSDGTHVWWYFEVDSPDDVRPTFILQRMFFEREDRYTNRVIVLNQDPPFAVTLTPRRPNARIDKRPNEPSVLNEPTAVEPEEPES